MTCISISSRLVDEKDEGDSVAVVNKILFYRMGPRRLISKAPSMNTWSDHRVDGAIEFTRLENHSFIYLS